MNIVYLIKDIDLGLYKIGATKHTIDKRIKQLQTGNPSPIELIHTYYTNDHFKVERMLHNYYKDKKYNNEWFQLDAEDVSNFINECNKYQNIIDSLKENPYFY